MAAERRAHDEPSQDGANLADPSRAEPGLDVEARRLLWRCRRGMKELDLLLERYVRSHVGNASADDRATLTHLLELPDPQLADYLLGHIPATEPPLARLVAAIRACPV